MLQLGIYALIMHVSMCLYTLIYLWGVRRIDDHNCYTLVNYSFNQLAINQESVMNSVAG